MDKNKLNPWMISTVVLALVGGFLIGCNVQSPRQQAGAQSPAEVIVLNSPDVNVVNVPTVDLLGIPEIRIAGVFDPSNVIHIVTQDIAAGAVPVEVYVVPPGFKLYVTDIHLVPSGTGRGCSALSFYNEQFGSPIFEKGFADPGNVNNDPVEYTVSLNAPIVFESEASVYMGILSVGGTQSGSPSRFTISGFLKPTG